MADGADYWGAVIAARVQLIPAHRMTDDDRPVPAYGGFLVTAELFADDPGRFRPGGLVRVGTDLPPIGGIRAGTFVIEEADWEIDVGRGPPTLTVRMRSTGPVFLADPMTGAALPNPPAFLPVAPRTPPPPPPPIARPRPARRPKPRPEPPAYDPPGRRINLDD